MLAKKTPLCPCAEERTRREREGPDQSPVEASGASPMPLEELNEVLDRTLAYERLVSGREGVLGEAPPAYEAGSTYASHPPAIAV
jgi:hypothetical protein